MLPNALQPNETDHVPVLAEEVRELLAIEPGQTVVDATFGAGGHAAVLAADLKGDGRFIAIDRDPTVRPYFEGFKRHAGVQSRFLRGEASVVLDQLADNGVHADAILLDLGVSSMQIDRPERGFSYAADAPLDMRMDPTAELTAAELVNEASERELITIFRKYGEERYAKQIARAIGRRRRKQPIERTGDLVDIIRAAIPAPARFGDGHPAKRVFQALRIAVNDELGELEEALPAALEMLRPGRPPRRDRVPLARGSDRQALLPAARARLRLPAGLSRLRVRARARAQAAEPEGDPAERPRAGPQPARGLRQAARRSESLMSRAATARALPAPTRPRARPKTKPRAKQKVEPRRRVAGGVVWIGLVAALLAGVVALNVAVLRLNIRLDQTQSERNQLRADNAQLNTEIAAKAASGRILGLASGRLGLRPANPDYLDLRK